MSKACSRFYRAQCRTFAVGQKQKLLIHLLTLTCIKAIVEAVFDPYRLDHKPAHPTETGLTQSKKYLRGGAFSPFPGSTAQKRCFEMIKMTAFHVLKPYTNQVFTDFDRAAKHRRIHSQKAIDGPVILASALKNRGRGGCPEPAPVGHNGSSADGNLHNIYEISISLEGTGQTLYLDPARLLYSKSRALTELFPENCIHLIIRMNYSETISSNCPLIK